MRIMTGVQRASNYWPPVALPISAVVSQQDQFDRIVSALHDAALDDRLWPSTSALIDDAVGMAGSHLVVESGHTRDDAEVIFGDMYCHGELTEFGREYVETYFPPTNVSHACCTCTTAVWFTSPRSLPNKN